MSGYEAVAAAHHQRARARERVRNRVIGMGMALLGIALTLLLLIGTDGAMIAWAPTILLIGAGIAVLIEPDLLGEIGDLFR